MSKFVRHSSSMFAQRHLSIATNTNKFHVQRVTSRNITTNFKKSIKTPIIHNSFLRSFSNATLSAKYNQVPVVSDLLKLPMAEISKLLAAEKVTSVELVNLCLEQIENTNSYTNAYITVLSSQARRLAIESDLRRFEKKERGPYDGIPVAIKDNFCVDDVLTTAGSNVLSNFVSPYNATVVQRLINEGAIIIGKTNMDEFGMGSYGQNSFFGAVNNPLTNDNRTSGGSSSGSAAALASYTCYAAIGSDTGGSVRLPASYTGTVGLKPTYGTLSRHGLIAYGSSLDCPGVMARSIADARATFHMVVGPDELDSTCVFQHTDDDKEVVDLSNIRVGIPEELMFSELHQDIRVAWSNTAEKLKSLGAEVVSVPIPGLQHALSVYYTLAPAESVSNLSRYDGVRYGNSTYTAELSKSFTSEEVKNISANDVKNNENNQDKSKTKVSPLQSMYTRNRSKYFGDEVQKRITIGNFVLSSEHYNSYVGKAMEIRGIITSELTNLLTSGGNTSKTSDGDKIDILLFPTATTTAPTQGTLLHNSQENPVSGYIDDVMTIFANLSGLPALSLPVAAVKDNSNHEVNANPPILPIGMQIMGGPMSEYKLLSIAKSLEEVL